jgi:hypothetical protein
MSDGVAVIDLTKPCTAVLAHVPEMQTQDTSKLLSVNFSRSRWSLNSIVLYEGKVSKRKFKGFIAIDLPWLEPSQISPSTEL